MPSQQRTALEGISWCRGDVTDGVFDVKANTVCLIMATKSSLEVELS